MREILNRFRQVNVSAYPDVHLLTDEVDTILWVLLVGEEQLGIDAMSASEVANAITYVFRKDLSRQRAAAVLTSSKGLVSKVSESGITRFRLMRQGADRIRGRAGGVIFVDLSTAFTALRQLDQLLSSVEGELLLCDPYVDDKTLLALTSVPPTSPIKLLTLNISDPSQFRRRMQAYQREYGNLELRTSSTPDLHDRYVIDDERMWLLGQSLHGIGKKQSFIVAVGSDIQVLVHTGFLRRWNTAAVWS